MRVIVLGGTRFVGRALVAQLRAAGHEVLIVHRGEHEVAAEPGVAHVHVDRRRLVERRADLAAFGADAVIDLSAATAADTAAVLEALRTLVPVPRLVVVSSMDVYRAYASLWAGEITDAVPLTEDAALRTTPPPDQRGPAPAGWDIDMSTYDKVDVERAYLALGATVCRLPFVYGEHDANRREEFVLRRVRAGRRRMPIGPGAFLGSRGYAAELARGLRLVVEAGEALSGEVFNLCEPTCAPIRLWAEQIVGAAGAQLELVEVPVTALPPDLALTGNVSQHLLADPGRAARRLGWVHAPAEDLVRRSVAWHLRHPPDDARDGGDFSADDIALAAAGT